MHEFRVLFISLTVELYKRVHAKFDGDFWKMSHCRPKDLSHLLDHTDTDWDFVIIEDVHSKGEKSQIDGFHLVWQLKSKKSEIMILPIVSPTERVGTGYLEAGCPAYLSVPIGDETFFMRELTIRLRWAMQQQRNRRRYHSPDTVESLLSKKLSIDNPFKDLRSVLNDFMDNIQQLGFGRVRLYLRSEENPSMLGIASRGMEQEHFVGTETLMAEDPCIHVLMELKKPKVFDVSEDWPKRHGVDQWGCIPLYVNDTFVGKLGVDSKTDGSNITVNDLTPVNALARAVAGELIKARSLFLADIRARKLSALINNTLPHLSKLEQNEFLRETCRAAYDMLGAGHVGIATILTGKGRARVVAEFPKKRVGDKVMHLTGSLAKRIVKERKPLIVKNVETEAGLGPGRQRFLGLGIQSFMAVPICRQNEAIALMVVCHLRRGAQFSELEALVAADMAQHLAVTMENHRLYHDAALKVEQLDVLHKVALAVTSPMKRKDMLNSLVEEAVKLLDGQSGGIHSYDPQNKILKNIADYRRTDLVGEIIRLGEGMAGLLVESGEPFMVTANHDKEPYSLGPRRFKAMIQVPLKWRGEILGVLYVDDFEGREFNGDDAHLLELFADHVTIALKNDEHRHKARESARFLKQLTDSTHDGVIAIDMQGNIIRFNQRAGEMLGYTEEEAKAKTIIQIYERGIPKIITKQLREKGGITNFRTLLNTKSGTRLPVYLNVTWIYDEDGQRMGSLGVFEDQAERGVRDRLETFDKILELNTEVTELQPVLDEIASLAPKSCKADWCHVVILNQDLKTIKAQVTHGLTQPLERFQTAILAWSQALLKDRDAKAHVHAFSHQRQAERVDLKQVSSTLDGMQQLREALAFPIAHGNTLFGMIWWGRHGDTFTAAFGDHHIRLAYVVMQKTAAMLDRYLRKSKKEYRNTLLQKMEGLVQQFTLEGRNPQTLPIKTTLELLGYEQGVFVVVRDNVKQIEVRDATPGLNQYPGKRSGYTDTSIIGQVAADGKPRSVMPSEISEAEFKESFPDPMRGQTVLTVRLKSRVGLDHLLSVSGNQPNPSYVEVDLEVLGRLAVHIAEKLSTAQMMQQLHYLNEINSFIQGSEKLDDILYTVLTGVTSGGGLGFNRAILFCFDPVKKQHIARGAVGELNEQDASKAWQSPLKLGNQSLEQALSDKPIHTWSGTTLGKKIDELVIDVGKNSLIEGMMAGTEPIYGDRHSMHRLPQVLQSLMGPVPEFAILPLAARQGSIGWLYVDNHFTHDPIDDNIKTYLAAYAKTAAIAVDKERLRREKDAFYKMLKEAFTAGHDMVAKHEHNDILGQVTHKIVELAGAVGAGLAIKDQNDRLCLRVCEGKPNTSYASTSFITDTTSQEVMTGDEPRQIATAVDLPRDNPLLAHAGVVSAACLPFRLAGKPKGVLWFWYTQPTRLEDYVLETLSLLLNQAAVVHDNSRRVDFLSVQRDLSRDFAQIHEPKALRDKVLQGVQHFLKADALVLWHHDDSGNRLMSKGVSALGQTRSTRDELEKNSPVDSQKLNKSFCHIWNNVELSAPHQAPYLGQCFVMEEIKELLVFSLQSQDIHSQHKKTLAFIYVAFHEPRNFTHHDKEIITTFLRQASVAYEKTLLMHQNKQVTNTLKAVEALSKSAAPSSQVETHDHLIESEESWAVQEIIDSIAKQTKEFLECDSVVLYEYEKEVGDVVRVATHGIVKKIVEARIKESPVLKEVERHTRKSLALIQAEVVEDHKLFKESNFARDQHIKSCLVVPLGVPHRRVGWMFVNFKSRYRFSPSENEYIQLFANAVSEILIDAQLYKSTSQRADIFQKLNTAGQTISGVLDRDKMLAQVAHQAWIVNNLEEGKSVVDLLWVRDDNHLESVFSLPKDTQPSFAELYGNQFNIKKGMDGAKGLGQRKGVVGRAYGTKQTVLVPDVDKDQDYLPLHDWARSKMVVPITFNNRVIALIDLVHREENHFRNRHREAMEIFASQVTVALENIKNLERMKQAGFDQGNEYGMTWMQLFQRSLIHGIRNDAGAIDRNLLVIRDEMTETGFQLKNQKPLTAMTRLITHLRKQPFPENISESKVAPFNAVVKTLYEELKGRLDYSEVQFTIGPLKGSYAANSIKINTYWLGHVLHILNDNALRAIRKAKPKIGRLNWKLSAGKTHVHIVVEDNGGGIPDNIRHDLFKSPLHQDKTEGSGNGLYIAATICKNYQGSIQLLEPTKETETRIRVSLPVTNEEKSEPGKTNKKTNSGSVSTTASSTTQGERRMKVKPKGRILLVDDHEEFLEPQAELLINAGYLVKTAKNVQDAIAALESHNFAMAIIDVCLNNSDDPNDFSGFVIAAHPTAISVPKLLWSQHSIQPHHFQDWYGNAVAMSDLNISLESKNISHAKLLTFVEKTLEQQHGTTER